MSGADDVDGSIAEVELFVLEKNSLHEREPGELVDVPFNPAAEVCPGLRVPKVCPGLMGVSL